jgi:hypothetical protein
MPNDGIADDMATQTDVMGEDADFVGRARPFIRRNSPAKRASRMRRLVRRKNPNMSSASIGNVGGYSGGDGRCQPLAWGRG